MCDMPIYKSKLEIVKLLERSIGGVKKLSEGDNKTLSACGWVFAAQSRRSFRFQSILIIFDTKTLHEMRELLFMLIQLPRTELWPAMVPIVQKVLVLTIVSYSQLFLLGNSGQFRIINSFLLLLACVRRCWYTSVHYSLLLLTLFPPTHSCRTREATVKLSEFSIDYIM